MRNALLSILAGLLLLGAPGAAAAGSCQSANGCAMLEHDATANAKKAVLVDAAGTVAISGTAGVKANLVDASGDTAMDATANAVKTVVVDSAGTALVGGRGARVELLYSGTTTTVGTTYLDIVPAFAPPAWVTRVQIMMRVRAITIGPGATWSGNVYLADANGPFTGAAGNKTTYAFGTIVTPTVNGGFVASFGPNEPNIAGSLIAGASIATYPLPLHPMIGFTSKWTTAPTDWTLDWYVYGIGG